MPLERPGAGLPDRARARRPTATPVPTWSTSPGRPGCTPSAGCWARAARPRRLRRDPAAGLRRRGRTCATPSGRPDPSALRETVITAPGVSWSDIAGLDAVITLLRETVEMPLQHPDAFADVGLSPSSGVLLYGEPGTGKSHAGPRSGPGVRHQPRHGQRARDLQQVAGPVRRGHPRRVPAGAAVSTHGARARPARCDGTPPDRRLAQSRGRTRGQPAPHRDGRRSGVPVTSRWSG